MGDVKNVVDQEFVQLNNDAKVKAYVVEREIRDNQDEIRHLKWIRKIHIEMRDEPGPYKDDPWVIEKIEHTDRLIAKHEAEIEKLKQNL